MAVMQGQTDKLTTLSHSSMDYIKFYKLSASRGFGFSATPIAQSQALRYVDNAKRCQVSAGKYQRLQMIFDMKVHTVQ